MLVKRFVFCCARPSTQRTCCDIRAHVSVLMLVLCCLLTPQMLAEACVAVATHRHGCCVLQRAIDAATVEQSRLLVSHVSQHALQLMQV